MFNLNLFKNLGVPLYLLIYLIIPYSAITQTLKVDFIRNLEKSLNARDIEFIRKNFKNDENQNITKQFAERGYRVIVFEKNPLRREYAGLATHYQNLAVLMANADVIIGCTGTDITQDDPNLSALLYSQTKKWLISTSSKDLEFKDE